MSNKIKRTHHDVYPYISPTGRLSGTSSGQTILITGAGTGCGRAIALAFAHAGASTLILTGRTQSTLDETAAELRQSLPSCKPVVHITDVTREDSVDGLFRALRASKLVPDVLVNNSGFNLVEERIADSDPLQWWSTVEVSLKGTYLMTRAYLGLLGLTEGAAAAGGGAGSAGASAAGDASATTTRFVINLSSGASDVISPTMSAYGTAKQAVNRFTEMLQLEYGGRGVRAFAMTPGGVRATGMGAKAPPQFANRLLDSVDLCGAFAVYLTTEGASFLAGRYSCCNWDVERLERLKGEVEGEGLLVSRLLLGEGISNELVGRDGEVVGFLPAKGDE